MDLKCEQCDTTLVETKTKCYRRGHKTGYQCPQCKKLQLHEQTEFADYEEAKELLKEITEHEQKAHEIGFNEAVRHLTENTRNSTDQSREYMRDRNPGPSHRGRAMLMSYGYIHGNRGSRAWKM